MKSSLYLFLVVLVGFISQSFVRFDFHADHYHQEQPHSHEHTHHDQTNDNDQAQASDESHTHVHIFSPISFVLISSFYCDLKVQTLGAISDVILDVTELSPQCRRTSLYRPPIG